MRCQICLHPRLAYIDREAQKDRPLLGLARETGAGYEALRRHVNGDHANRDGQPSSFARGWATRRARGHDVSRPPVQAEPVELLTPAIHAEVEQTYREHAAAGSYRPDPDLPDGALVWQYHKAAR